MVRIHQELPDDLHRRAKSAAALQGISLKEFVERALEEKIERDDTPAKARKAR